MAEQFELTDGNLEKLAKALGKGNVDLKDLDKLKDQLKTYTTELKRSQPAFKSFNTDLEKTTGFLKDTRGGLENLADAIKKATEAEKKATTEEERMAAKSRKETLESQRVSIAGRGALSGLGTAAGVAAEGVATMATNMLQGALDFAKGLQAGQAGTELYGAAAKRAAESTGELISTVGQVVEALGAVVSFASWFIPGGAIIKAVKFGVMAITGLGFAADLFGKATKKVAGETVQYFNDEITKTTKSFADMTSTGAEFAGGMTEMRKEAANAGLDVAQFGSIIKDNQQDLAHMGMGVGEAAKRLGAVSAILRDPSKGLGAQLLKLGYSVEDQVALSAQVSSQLRAAGTLEATSKEQLAELTVRYGKDLKILADITGQDAKKKAEQARLASMQADIMAKLGPKEQERFQAQLRGMPEALQKGFIQYVVSGGTAVTDRATAILMSQYPEVEKTFKNGLANVKSSMDTSAVQQAAIEQGARLGQSMKDMDKRTGAFINVANTLGNGANAAVNGVSDLRNAVGQQTNYTEEAAKKGKIATEKAATNQEKLDKSVEEMTTTTQTLRAALGDKLTKPLADFADGLVTSGDIIAEFNKMAQEKFGIGVTGPAGKGAGGEAGAGGPGASMYTRIKGSLATMFTGGAGTRQAAGGAGMGPLRMKSDESTGGGEANPKLIELANLIQQQAGSDLKYFSAFNDRYHHGLDRSSSHTKGTALDFVLDDPSKAQQYVAMVNGMPGVKPGSVINEYANLSKGGTGGHIHAEVEEKLAEGGITQGPSLAGEAGPEAVVPLPDGRTIPVKMDWSEMRETFNEMIRVMKDHKDVSEKTLRASQ
jgi:hypothetical protein